MILYYLNRIVTKFYFQRSSIIVVLYTTFNIIKDLLNLFMKKVNAAPIQNIVIYISDNTISFNMIPYCNWVKKYKVRKVDRYANFSLVSLVRSVSLTLKDLHPVCVWVTSLTVNLLYQF